MYVVRLSCELPYAVGVRKNTAHSITGRQRKQSTRQTTSAVLFESLVPEYFCTHQLVLFFSAHAPLRPGIRATQSPQVGLEPRTTVKTLSAKLI